MARSELIPVLHTPRLTLRPFDLTDAPRVRELAGDARVAATTASVPHPYPDGAAETWIGTHAGLWHDCGHAAFAICTEADGLVGCIGLITNLEQHRAELGYWIGHPYWGRGYCTEAGRAVVDFGFDHLALRRVYACHMASNPASGRVMEKLGLWREGVLRGHQLKNGVPHDLIYHGRLRDDS